MSRYHLLSDAAADADIEAAFEWYESEQPELGVEFLNEVRATYKSHYGWPIQVPGTSIWHQARPNEKISIWSYFSVEDDHIVVIAVLDTARDPAEWQFRV